MSLGTTIIDGALAALDCHQHELAGKLNYSRKTVSAIKCGDRRLQLDMLQSLVALADDPDVYENAINLITGGVGPFSLDGPYADLTPAAVLDWVINELTETVEAARACKVLRTRKPPSEWTPEEAAQVERFAHQDREAFLASWLGLKMVCRARRASMRAEFEALRKECADKGFAKTEKAVATGMATTSRLR